jgi:threonine/homoserine/homoserine lactone efflux protein
LELSSWLSIAAVCATGAVSPGPSLAVVVRNTVLGGRLQGVLTGLGHGIGVGIYAFGAVAGVSALVASVPGLHRGLAALGGAYLIWMGVQAILHAGEAGHELGVSGRKGFAEGFLVAFLNPKIAVFFLALLGSFLPPQADLEDRAGVAALAMGIDAAWYMFAAAVLATTGAAARLAAAGSWVDRGLGAVLVLVGLVLLGGALLG